MKGTIEPGKFADLVVLSADYFSVAEDKIKELESVLTIVAGKPVYGAQEFSKYSPERPSVPIGRLLLNLADIIAVPQR